MLTTKAHDFDEKERTKDVLIDEQLNFNSFVLSEATLKGLQKLGFVKPSPIQLKAIPIGKCGFDLMVKSKSGTGKTLVFSLIALELINLSKAALQVLILAPTREIAVQIENILKDLGSDYTGLVVHSFIGGLSFENDVKKLSKCHIAVGAPGRIKHLLQLGALKLKNVKLFVLDEVDKLAEESMMVDIAEISNKLPSLRQVISASATYSKEAVQYLEKIMSGPTLVEPNTDTPLLLGIKQFAIIVKGGISLQDKLTIKRKQVERILTHVSYTQCIVFTNYQVRAESVSNFMNQENFETMYITASQKQKERLHVINSLKNGTLRILTSTDVTARGIDASNVDLIINFDVPFEASTYLHRMGRAGRFGSKGICVSILPTSEVSDFRKMLGNIGGAKFCLPKLPVEGDLPSDLLNFDTNSLEVIQSLVDENKLEKEQKDIVDSVFHYKRFKSACTKKGNNETDDDKELSVENVQSMLDINKINETFINAQHEESDVLDLLKSIAGEDNSKRNEDEPPKSNLELSENAIGHAKTKLEDGNFENQQSNNKNLIKEFLESEKNKTQSLESQYSEVDVSTLLNVIVNEKVPPTSENTENIQILNNILTEISNDKEIKIDETSTKPDSDPTKKRKRTTSTQKKTLSNKDFNYCKNMALMNVVKLLENPHIHNISEDISSSLDKYMEISRNKTEEDFGEILDDNDENDVLTSIEKGDLISSEVKIVETTESTIQDVFKLGYDYATKPGTPYWLDVLGEQLEDASLEEKEEKEVITFVRTPKKRYKSGKRYKKNQDIEMDYEFCAQEQSMDICEESNESVKNLQHQENFPVMEQQNQVTFDQPFNRNNYYHEYSGNQHFIECFQKYSNELADNLETFEDISSFENYYQQWEWQVQSVRDYVQQNIYLQEMNKSVYGQQ